MKRGDKVRFKGRLGKMIDPMDTRFEGSTEPGDEGIYVGKHPNKKLKDWLICKTGDDMFVPVHPSHIEAV